MIWVADLHAMASANSIVPPLQVSSLPSSASRSEMEDGEEGFEQARAIFRTTPHYIMENREQDLAISPRSSVGGIRLNSP